MICEKCKAEICETKAAAGEGKAEVEYRNLNGQDLHKFANFADWLVSNPEASDFKDLLDNCRKWKRITPAQWCAIKKAYFQVTGKWAQTLDDAYRIGAIRKDDSPTSPPPPSPEMDEIPF